MATSFYDPGEQRGRKVNALFQQIAARYALVNDLQSFGLHRRWKARVAELAKVRNGDRALDVCCGTGDICLTLARQGAEVIGLDFTNEMLQRAQARPRPERSNEDLKSRSRNAFQRGIHFIRGDAQKIPFADNAFDAVTVGYGLRNLADWRIGIREMTRVAKPGGRLVILEFGKPENAIWRSIYIAYLKICVPSFGLLFFRNTSTYGYILESLNHYPSQLEIAESMRRDGLESVQVYNMLGGAMSIHYAQKATNA